MILSSIQITRNVCKEDCDRLKKTFSSESFRFVLDTFVRFVEEYNLREGESKLWRLSFSAAEKRLLLHADGLDTFSCNATCRKDVLRLLKQDLVVWQEEQKSSTICSFFLKTTVLHLFDLDHLSRDSSWSQSDLRLRYLDALHLLVFYLQARYICHYFIEDENLLSLQEHHWEELRRIEKYFKNQINIYTI